MTLEEYIEVYEKQIRQKDSILNQIEKDQLEKRSLTVKDSLIRRCSLKLC